MSGTCGCCSGVHAETPRLVTNRPGLTAIAYRAGDYASFYRSMIASLTGDSPIARLTSRDDDDFSIALLDAWAVTSDVLTFYQERIANESYLRTAAERVSVLELARLIGYELAPGVAAAALLAFTVDDAEGAPKQVQLEPGLRVQSIPGQDEVPQTFELIERLEARAPWNELKARTSFDHAPSADDVDAFIAGTTTPFRLGDGLLFLGKAAPQFRRVARIRQDFEGNRTQIRWSESLTSDAESIWLMTVEAGLFGHNAPHPATLKNPIATPTDATDWTFEISTSEVLVDGAHPAIVPKSHFVISTPGVYPVISTVSTVAEVAVARYALTGRAMNVTLPEVPAIGKLEGPTYRKTHVFGGPELLTLAPFPVGTPTLTTEIDVDTPVAGLESRTVIVRGVVAGKTDVETEEAVIARVDGGTKLIFASALANRYEPSTLRVFANVARATHGETVREVLGNGDAALAFQRFRLASAPMTYVPDRAEPDGAKSTLSVFVNDIRWTERATLYGAGPDARVYTTRRDDEGHTWVQFGDGRDSGARLPTGSNNVRAIYRKGLGEGGNVRAGQLTLLMTQPLGLSGVTNPRPARGGADAQDLADARTNAPRTVRTLDRVVSLRDYEYFAAGFAGISKAIASWSWTGTVRQVMVTVAGPGGAAFAKNDPVLRDLAAALLRFGKPYIPLRILSFRPAPFRIVANVGVAEDHVAEIVLAKVHDTLMRAFAFEARSFGEAVDLSDIVKVIHSVDGVVSVDIDELRRIVVANIIANPVVLPLFARLAITKKLNDRLTAALPKQDAEGTLIPAEILILKTADIREARR